MTEQNATDNVSVTDTDDAVKDELIQLKVTEGFKHQAKIEAAKRNVTLSDLIREKLREAIEETPEGGYPHQA